MSKLKFLERTKYPRETRRVHLVKYHKDLNGDYIDVWVNWSRAISDKSLELAREAGEVSRLSLGEERDQRLAALNEAVFEFQSSWWDVPVEEVRQLYGIDVTLYNWVIDESNRLRSEYVDERKKAASDSTDS